MNSEKLELSLRAEFESYLKSVVARMQQDVSDFQKNFEGEFEKHKTQLDDAIRNLSTRFESTPEFDRAFSESVIEHLRLARDDGATITAEAIGEAEKLKAETEPPPPSYDQIRDAVKDITCQTSQSAILKSLVENAAQFAPRGAFFIVKNDHFVGWKVFGSDGGTDDRAVQEIHFPVSADTLLSSASSSLNVRDEKFGTHAEDALFLDPLGFGQPARMHAIPLSARGRGVAVMYADHGTSGAGLNADALETLIRVAGLTVELLAASNEAKSQQESIVANAEKSVPAAAEVVEPVAEVVPDESYAVVEQSYETISPAPAPEVKEYTGAVSFETAAPVESPEVEEMGTVDSYQQAEENRPADDDISYFEPETDSEAATRDFAISSNESYDAAGSDWEVQADAPHTETAVEEYVVNGNGGVPAVERAVVETASVQPARGRYSDRNVDLPIDVSDDERRPHNNARRFARLLVSEIKLYNEQKVVEGREANDLYDRLRDAIDRSREMYEKRVEPEVASKFDYFHYELVNGLADGSDERLGQSYPGSSN